MQRRQLQYFIEVVDCGSISAAAQKLFVAQPSLSRTINALEKEMGCELLERTSKGVRPTQTGRQMYFTMPSPFWINFRCWSGCGTRRTPGWSAGCMWRWRCFF